MSLGRKEYNMRKNKILVILLLLISSLFILTSCDSKKDDVVKVIDIELTEEEYAYVVKKGNTSLVNDFNIFLDEIIENGTLEEIVVKYFKNGQGKIGVPYTDSSDISNDEKTFVVATNCPFAPFEYIDTDGLVYGIDIEVAKLYADSKGLDLVIKNLKFEAIFTSVDAGFADIGMAGITVDSDRLASYDFTNAYYKASQKLVVATDNHIFDDCETVEDVETILNGLENKTLGYQNGTVGSMYVVGEEEWGFPGFENLKHKGYDSAQMAIQDIANGNIFGVILDEAPATTMVNAINSLVEWEVKVEVFKDSLSSDYFQKLIVQGLVNTLIIAVCGLLIGIVIGTLIAIVKVTPKYKRIVRIFDKVCTVYIAIFRGTPIVVQLLLTYYVLLPIMGITGVPSLVVAVIVFGLNSGAYVAEIMRGGINSIDKGQLEAGRALGLGYWTTMIKIVIPQAIKNIIPTLGNEFISLIKETSVVSFIAVADLYKAFNDIGTNNYEVIIPYCAMALIYVILIIVISLLVKLIEKGLARSDRSN